jgi:hypothetical protein
MGITVGPQLNPVESNMRSASENRQSATGAGPARLIIALRA